MARLEIQYINQSAPESLKIKQISERLRLKRFNPCHYDLSSASQLLLVSCLSIFCNKPTS